MQKKKIDLKPFGIIAAVSLNGVIGVNGELPWNVPDDRKLFEDITRNKTLIIGRKTLFEDSGGNFDHISHCRRVFVVSRTLREEEIEQLNRTKSQSLPTLHVASSVEEAVCCAQAIDDAETLSVDSLDDHEMDPPLSSVRCWIGGGEAIYASALQLPQARFLYLTVMNTTIEIPNMGATNKDIAFFPDRWQWGANYIAVSKTEHSSCDPIPFTTFLYERIPSAEGKEVD
eukprot:scaffold6438_cov181-Amphora_coffeaeformis.AAC.7